MIGAATPLRTPAVTNAEMRRTICRSRMCAKPMWRWMVNGTFIGNDAGRGSSQPTATRVPPGRAARARSARPGPLGVLRCACWLQVDCARYLARRT